VEALVSFFGRTVLASLHVPLGRVYCVDADTVVIHPATLHALRNGPAPSDLQPEPMPPAPSLALRLFDDPPPPLFDDSPPRLFDPPPRVIILRD
jgi:hypothetical protein